MHELYLAEQILKQILETTEKTGSENVIEARIAIPEDEHFTPKEFKEILEMQAEGTEAQNISFIVFKEKTDKIYIKSIEVE